MGKKVLSEYIFKEKECVVCKKVFIPKSNRQLCCCTECSKIRNTTVAKESIEKNKEEHLKKRRESRELNKNIKLFPIPCKHCRTIFTPKNKNIVMCSSKCRDIFNSNFYKEKRKEDRKKPKQKINCRRCNILFIPKHGLEMFCSDDCRNKQQQENGANNYILNIDSISKRHREYSKTEKGRIKSRECMHRRRALGKKVKSEKINLEQINYRDHHCCLICLNTIDMNLKFPDKHCVVYDHIYPVSKGGANINDNITLAHNVCNIKKGNKIHYSIIHKKYESFWKDCTNNGEYS